MKHIIISSVSRLIHEQLKFFWTHSLWTQSDTWRHSYWKDFGEFFWHKCRANTGKKGTHGDTASSVSCASKKLNPAITPRSSSIQWIHIHTPLHTWTHTYATAYMDTYICHCIHGHIHMPLHTWTHTYATAYMDTYIRHCIHGHIHMPLHTWTHTYATAYMDTYICHCIHGHIHTPLHTWTHTCIRHCIHGYKINRTGESTLHLMHEAGK